MRIVYTDMHIRVLIGEGVSKLSQILRVSLGDMTTK